MKKLVFLLLLPLLLLSLAEGEFNYLKKTDAERAGLKGKVKALYESEYGLQGFEPDDISMYKADETTTELYNTDGNLINRRHYVRDDSMWMVTTYGYNGKQRAWQTYEMGDTIRYAYDQRGNLIETLWPPGSIYHREAFVYDANNLLIRHFRIEDDGDTTYWIEQSNDTIRHVVRRVAHFVVDTVEYRNSYIYTKGRLTSDSSWTGGRVSGNTYTYVHDKQGNCTEKVKGGAFPRSRGDVTSMSYVYDKKGNWTKRKTYRNGQLHEVTYREIEYY